MRSIYKSLQTHWYAYALKSHPRRHVWVWVWGAAVLGFVIILIFLLSLSNNMKDSSSSSSFSFSSSSSPPSLPPISILGYSMTRAIRAIAPPLDGGGIHINVPLRRRASPRFCPSDSEIGDVSIILSAVDPIKAGLHYSNHWSSARPLFQGVAPLLMAINNPVTDTLISAGIQQKGLWEPPIVRIMVSTMVQHQTAGMVFVDVGANVGYFSLLAVSSGFFTYSFEPMLINCKRITQTMRQHHKLSHNKWILYQNAVDSVTGESVRLQSTDHASNSGNHRVVRRDVKPVGFYGDDYVTTVRLDDVLAGEDRTIVLLKIDAESYDIRVIDGAIETLCTKIVRNIVMEVAWVRKTHCDWRRMLRWLKDVGYIVKNVKGVHINQEVWDREEWKVPDNIWLQLEDMTQSPAERMGKKGRQRCITMAREREKD